MFRIDDDVALAPFHAGFAPDVAAHVERDRERMGRWLRWVEHGGGEAAVRAFAATVEERRALDLGDNFAIVVGGAFAGSVDIHDVNRAHAVAAVGYWLGSAYGGRGIMTRAVRAVAQLAFTQHRIHRLELFAAAGNHPSRAVAERAGFALEATLRERLWAPHGFDDAALYVRFAP
jgi:ribosomal-protein-serine acetyltransferase